MRRSKIFHGICLLILSACGAGVSKAMQGSEVVWFDNNGTPEQTTVPFLGCRPGDPTCIGFEGASEGKQLYLDQQLTIVLEEN